MSPENQWLEDVFPIKIVPFKGQDVSFREGNLKGFQNIPKRKGRFCKVPPKQLLFLDLFQEPAWIEPRKKKGPGRRRIPMKYWLFNRDPYKGLW